MVFSYMPAPFCFDRTLSAQQVRETGVLDLSRRKPHLVRGGDRFLVCAVGTAHAQETVRIALFHPTMCRRQQRSRLGA